MMRVGTRVPDTVYGVPSARIFTPPWHGRELTPENSRGFEFVEWSREHQGWEPFPWQEWLAHHSLELSPDGSGKYRFRTVIVLVGRQSGKTTYAGALSNWKIGTHPECRLVVGAAQVVDGARECWSRAWELGQDAGMYTAQNAKKYDANGRERFEVLKVGADASARGIYQIVAMSRRAGRGKSVDHLNLDELREQQNWEGWASLSKTTNARPNPQILIISNAGDALSVVLNHFVARGRESAAAGGDYEGDLFLAEWSGPEGCDLTDVDALRQACPAVGHTIPISVLLGQAADEPPDIIRTEVLCQTVVNMSTAVDIAAWTEMSDERANSLATLGAGRVILFFESTPDGRHAALLAATPADADGRTRAEIVAAWDSGVGGVAMRKELRAIVSRIRPRKIGIFARGPAVSVRPDLIAATRKGGVAPPVLVSETPAACMSLASLISGRRVLHGGEALLHAQLASAVKHSVGDLWVFARKDGGGYVDSVFALAGATYLAMLDPSAGGFAGGGLVEHA
jgi:hypothetical protein